MYGAIVEWSHAFDAGILLPEVDLPWLMRPDPAVRSWPGSLEALPGVTLVQCGGHVAALAQYRFERIYGGWWDPVIRNDGERIVEHSAERYIEIVRGEFDPAPQPSR